MARLIPLLAIALGVYFWLKARKKTTEFVEGVSGAAPSAPRARRNRKSGPARAAAELGLVPADELDTAHAAAPDPRDEEIRATVRSGNWQAGADFLAEAGRDWQERYRRAGVLQDEAAADDTWLLAWRTARPEDAGAAFVHAGALISVAADIRGAKQAKYTTQEQFAGFHRMMAQAREACHEAQELAGDDPGPYIAEISCALGLGYGHDDFRALWAEVEKRDAHHLAAHTSALQYWCRKWRGSHELAERFAREAAQKGSPGRLLSLLPLYAAFEQESAEQDLDPDVFYKSPELIAAVDACLIDVAAAAAADPEDRRIVRVRHLLAWLLYWQDRYDAALEQYRAIDGYIDSAPWTYSGDPKARYVQSRDFCAAQVLAAGGN
ncbi:hypothetical protein [Streptomyces sp. NBC_00624]|uniref:hypothetical protein n=1 Tax=Streptomyces sp. NBC_00624 TaxID=2975791 RepID=UPI0030E14956